MRWRLDKGLEGLKSQLRSLPQLVQGHGKNHCQAYKHQQAQQTSYDGEHAFHAALPIDSCMRSAASSVTHTAA
jgi:hypothetical protein